MHNLTEMPESEFVEEPVDRTKWIWLGVIILIAVSIVLVWATTRQPRMSTVRAKHILIKFDEKDSADRSRALNEITELRERILKGEKFETLAKEYSNDTYSAARGGDLGYYKRGSFDPDFEEYVWEAPVGELSDVIKSSFGFHIVKVVDRRLSGLDQYEADLKEKVERDDEPPSE